MRSDLVGFDQVGPLQANTIPMLNFLTLKNQNDLIADVVMFPLKVNRDPRGILVETLKTNWEKVYGPGMEFAQMYYSITEPGVARDVDRWHYHPTKQIDRFGVIQGELVVAIYDWRSGSPTFGKLNLFLMGESNGDDGQYLLLIPRNTLHGFVVVSQKPAILFNFPNHLYDPTEEGRLPHSEYAVNFPDGRAFSWEIIKEEIYTSGKGGNDG